MKKAKSISLVFPEEKYCLPDTECRQAKLLSMSHSRDPRNFNNNAETVAKRSKTEDPKSIIKRSPQMKESSNNGSEVCHPATITEDVKQVRFVTKKTRDVSTSTMNTGDARGAKGTTTLKRKADDDSVMEKIRKAASATIAANDSSATAADGKNESPMNKVTKENGSSTKTAVRNEAATGKTTTANDARDILSATTDEKQEAIVTEKQTEDTTSSVITKEAASDLENCFGTSNKCARIIQKNGYCNVSYINVPKRNLMFLSDYFTSVLEMRWRFLLLMFLCGYISSWLFFSGLWFSLAKVHGDLDEITANATKPTPCIWNAETFAAVLLFSMETQTTIGYGYRYVSEECPVGIMLLISQSICGLLLQIFLAGSVLTKIQVPKKRAKTIAFSKKACIALIKGEPCLMIRVGNLRLSEVVEANLRAMFVLHKDVDGKVVRPYTLQEMKMGNFGDIDSRLTLWWPSTIFHKINESSPLYKMTPDKMNKCHFEIIIIMEGVVSSTSMSFQARSSYLQNEIVWGFEFAHTFKANFSTSKFPIDFKHFDDVTIAMDSSRLSAEEFLKLPRKRQPIGIGRKSFCVLD